MDIDLISFSDVFKRIRKNIIEDHFQFLFIKPKHDHRLLGVKMEFDILMIGQFLKCDVYFLNKRNNVIFLYLQQYITTFYFSVVKKFIDKIQKLMRISIN